MNLTEAVKAAGVVGAGGAGFPTHVKLSAKAECFLVNAAECEPLIETDKYLCRTFPDRVVAAAVAVAGHLGAKRTVIALKGKYHAEITALEGAISRSGAQVELFRMKTFYPAGDEQTMVQQVTGRSVPERGLPLDVGCVVDNVGTLLNIQDALEGTPVTEKYLSVVGEVKELKQRLDAMKDKLFSGEIDRCLFAAREVGGLKVLTVMRNDIAPNDLRKMGDQIRDREPDAVAVLASTQGERSRCLPSAARTRSAAASRPVSSSKRFPQPAAAPAEASPIPPWAAAATC